MPLPPPSSSSSCTSTSTPSTSSAPSPTCRCPARVAGPCGFCGGAGCRRRYKALKALGYGAFGTVFLVQDLATGLPLAMKVVGGLTLARCTRSVERLEIERAILSELRHPFLPSLHAYLDMPDLKMLLMDYCPGGDMNALRKSQPERRFTEAVVRFYAAEVLLALKYLHEKGIVYRDLKPENILVQESGHIMLTDFDLSLRFPVGENGRIEAVPSSHKKSSNISSSNSSSSSSSSNSSGSSSSSNSSSTATSVVVSKWAAFRGYSRGHSRGYSSKSVKEVPRVVGGAAPCTSRVTPLQDQTGKPRSRCNSFVGTEEYMAPEMIWGEGYDQSVDWWAYGVLLYEMSYGSSPFKGESRRDTFYRILSKEPLYPGNPSSSLHDLIRRLLVKQPSRRVGMRDVISHPFFNGVQWDKLHHVTRPPFIFHGPALVADLPELDVDRHLAKVEAARAHVSQMKRCQQGGADIGVGGCNNKEPEPLIKRAQSQRVDDCSRRGADYTTASFREF